MRTNYDLISKLIHWSMAIILISLVVVGVYMHDMPDGADKWQMYGLHKSFGVIALFLIAVRIVWRIKNPVAKMVGISDGDYKKAKAIQGILYLLMLMIPVAGLVMSWSGGYSVAVFGLELPSLIAENEALHDIAGETHELAAFAMIFFVLLHAGAALYHHFIKKDDTLKRITRS